MAYEDEVGVDQYEDQVAVVVSAAKDTEPMHGARCEVCARGLNEDLVTIAEAEALVAEHLVWHRRNDRGLEEG